MSERIRCIARSSHSCSTDVLSARPLDYWLHPGDMATLDAPPQIESTPQKSTAGYVSAPDSLKHEDDAL